MKRIIRPRMPKQVSQQPLPGIRLLLGRSTEHESKVLSGLDAGLEMRKHLKLDERDNDDEVYQIIVPGVPVATWAMTATYFHGCFGPSMQTLGPARFRMKYLFDLCSPNIRATIEDGVRRAIKDVFFLSYIHPPQQREKHSFIQTLFGRKRKTNGRE